MPDPPTVRTVSMLTPAVVIHVYLALWLFCGAVAAHDDLGKWRHRSIKRLQNISHDEFDETHSLFATFDPTTRWWVDDYQWGAPASGQQLVAHVYRSRNVQGWDRLHIVTTVDVDEYYVAGYAEGFLTYDTMYSMWQNQLMEVERDLATTQRDTGAFINDNIDFLDRRLQASTKLNRQVQRHVRQLHGLAAGWAAGYAAAKEPGTVKQPLSFLSIFLLNFIDELLAVMQKYGHAKPSNMSSPRRGVALLKLTEFDVHFGHNTWADFSMALRQLKSYDFSNAVTVMMASYPGSISSLDDFYVTSDGIAIADTSLPLYNASLYQQIRSQSIPVFARMMATTMIAESAEDWVTTFVADNNGTMGNEIVVVDLKTISALLETGTVYLPNKTAFVVNAIPGFVESRDVSEYVNKNGYFASYDIPWLQASRQRAGYEHRGGESYWGVYNWAQTPVAGIFDQMQGEVDDITAAYYAMRFNNFKDDHASTNPWCAASWTTGTARCDSDNMQNPLFAIASRGDLGPAVPMASPGGVLSYRRRAFGAIDTKLTSARMAKNAPDSVRMIAISGPTTVQQSVFELTEYLKQNPHERQHVWDGVPTTFHFDPVQFTVDAGTSSDAEPAKGPGLPSLAIAGIMVCCLAVVGLTLFGIVRLRMRLRRSAAAAARGDHGGVQDRDSLSPSGAADSPIVSSASATMGATPATSLLFSTSV